MSSPETSPTSISRRRRDSAQRRDPEVMSPTFPELVQGSQSDRLEALVDRVVERIEQRVVDELERRGRRHSRGVF
jgi:hypothetical protein